MAKEVTYEGLEQRVKELEKENVACRQTEGALREAETALRESEEKYRSMMEAMNDPVYICSPDRVIEYMNPAMAERVKRNATGTPCHKTIHELDEECPWCVHNEIQGGEPYETEIVSPKDGRFYHVSHSPIFHMDGSISKMTIFRDLTRFKQTQEALKKGEERYRLLTENVADGVAILQEGKFQFVNPAITSIFGYKRDKMIGLDPIVLFHEDHKERFSELVGKLEKGITVESFQALCIRGDGKEIWVEGRCRIIDWEGRPAVLVTVRDITETKLRELAIDEERDHFKRESTKLRSSLKDRYRFENIIGKSLPMQEVYEHILQASNSDGNVVIYGESGTGKELVSQAIHDMSKRHEKSLVTVNCGALPETLFESEFFGYKKGAFTGAYIDKKGYLDLADGGTLFLDEVGELSLNMQVKLLRAIDGGGYTPVGSNQTKNSDFRIIAATNRDLVEQLKEGLMRQDFFYRVHVIPITLPPLRDRKEDIPLLIDHFLKLHGNGKGLQDFSGKIIETLYNYDWPGNVRELENVLKRYLTTNRLDFISPDGDQAVDKGSISGEGFHQEGQGQFETLEAVEKRYISKVLEKNHWHRSKTARILGLPERTFYRKLKKYQVI